MRKRNRTSSVLAGSGSGKTPNAIIAFAQKVRTFRTYNRGYSQAPGNTNEKLIAIARPVIAVTIDRIQLGRFR
jgi:hypothetical protein